MNLETNVSKVEGQSKFNWRLLAVLLALVAFGLIAMIPYGLTIAGQPFSNAALLGLIPQFFGQILLYSFLIWAGLMLGSKIGLGVPWIENWTNYRPSEISTKRIVSPIVIGIAAGIGMILFDIYIFVPRLAVEIQLAGETVRPPAWQGFLASFYGGIVEEVMLRLFFLTLLAWLGSKLRRSNYKPGKVIMWIAILISGLAFGIAHLPTAIVMGIELTPLFIICTLTLNSVGILYGWLYWKRGFESSMLAHFSTDIVVHFLGALLLG